MLMASLKRAFQGQMLHLRFRERNFLRVKQFRACTYDRDAVVRAGGFVMQAILLLRALYPRRAVHEASGLAAGAAGQRR